MQITFLINILIILPTVHQRSDRLCIGGSKPVRLPSPGEPPDYPRHQTVRGPLLIGHLPQLQTRRLLWPEAAGPSQPHRYVQSLPHEPVNP